MRMGTQHPVLYFFRVLKAVRYVALFFALLPPVSAQDSNREKPEKKFLFSASSIGLRELPDLYWPDEKREGGKRKVEWKRLDVPNETRGAFIELPLKEDFQLYSGDPVQEGSMRPYLRVPTPRAGNKIFLLFHLDSQGNTKHIFLEEATDSHPAGTMRAVNLTDDRIAVALGGKPEPVLPSGEKVIQPTLRPDGRFGFQYFQERRGLQPYESPLLYMRFPVEGMRVLTVFAPVPVDPETDDSGKPRGKISYEPGALQLFDRQPGYVASSTPRPQMTPAPVLEATTTSVAPASAAAPSSSRECELGVLALGPDWSGREVDLEVSGQSGRIRSALEPGKIIPVKVPASGETRIALSHAGLPLGEVTLGQSAISGLLALAPPAHIEDPAVSRLFETSEQSHPRGTTRIFNLTPYQMAFTSGGKPVYVNPQSSALIEGVKPGAEIPLKLALEVDGGWKLIDQSPKKSPASDKRTGLFVYPGAPDSGSFNVLEKTL